MALLDGWIADLSAGKTIGAFSDMTLAPTPTDLVCAAIIALLQDRLPGIFQFTGPRDVSYAEVGRFLATYCNADPLLVKETSARSAGLPEGSTPANTTLDSTALRERYGLTAPDVWQVLSQLAANTRDARESATCIAVGPRRCFTG